MQVVCAASGIVAMLTEIPLVAISFFVILLETGVATAVVNAAAVDLISTNLRSARTMAHLSKLIFNFPLSAAGVWLCASLSCAAAWEAL